MFRSARFCCVFMVKILGFYIKYGKFFKEMIWSTQFRLESNGPIRKWKVLVFFINENEYVFSLQNI